MLFNDINTPLINSETNCNNLKHSTYKSIGKKDLSNEVTFELPKDDDSFTKMCKVTRRYLIEQEESFTNCGVVWKPLFGSEPFYIYFLYLRHKDPFSSEYRIRDPNSPSDWFAINTLLTFPHRFVRFPFENEFSVKFIPKRDVKSLVEKENDKKITIRLVWEDEEYIELRILKIVTLQSILNLVLREPTWTRRYQFFVDDHQLDIFDDIWHSLGSLEKRGLIYNHCIINIRLSPKSVRYTTFLYFLSHGHFFSEK